MKQLNDKNGHVNIVVSEGTNFNQSDPLFKEAVADKTADNILKAMLTEQPEIDPHGNMKLGGAGIIIQRFLALGLGVGLSRVRQSNIGFTLRGLPPNAFDINLGQRFGRAAVNLLHENKSGLMVGIRGMEIVTMPIKDALPQYTLDAMNEDELRDLGVFF